jgi:hypothetical protein
MRPIDMTGAGNASTTHATISSWGVDLMDQFCL